MSAQDLSASFFSLLNKVNPFRPQSRQTRLVAQLPLLPLGMAGAVMSYDDEEEGLLSGDVDIDGLHDIQGGYTPYLGRLTAVACLGGLQFGWVRRSSFSVHRVIAC
jgi:hypothetical protein